MVIRAVPVVLIVGLVWWLFGGIGSTSLSTDLQSAQSSAADDRAWLASGPPEARTVLAAITSSGYDCAALVVLRRRGASALGEKFEALCGPADGSGNGNVEQHYAVYPGKSIVHLCARFDDIAKECS